RARQKSRGRAGCSPPTRRPRRRAVGCSHSMGRWSTCRWSSGHGACSPRRRGAEMGAGGEAAPKDWRGRFYEDFAVGDVFRSRLGRTVTQTDNIWFTCLTLITNQVHFNAVQSERGIYGRPLVNSAFTLALVTGLTVPDTSEHAAANLAWTDITLPHPVFEGDTLWAESEILELRES